jgi:phage terminase small subunit
MNTFKTIKTTTLTPANKKFAHHYAISNNATQAVLKAFPHITSPASAGVKGTRLLKNDRIIMEIEAQKAELEAISSRAVVRIGELVDSEKEAIALEASKFTIDHVHGKATQKMELKSQHVVLTIDLSGGEAGEVPQEVLDELGIKALPEPKA